MITDDNDNLVEVPDNRKNPANLGPGILIPDLAYRFLVRYPHNGRFTKEAGDVLTSSTTNCEIDYVNKTIAINIEQPASQGDLHDVITYLIDQPAALIVESIAGDGEANYAITFGSCRCIEHEYRLDYACDGAAVHKMVFKYQRVSTKNREELS
jgi:hypothetical protein